jgi:hypothetical protein
MAIVCNCQVLTIGVHQEFEARYSSSEWARKVATLNNKMPSSSVVNHFIDEKIQKYFE